MKIIWTDTSLIKLKDIFDYHCEKASIVIARKLVNNIIQKVELLAINPQLGPIEELLVKRKVEYRYLVERNYKIIYSLTKLGIIIANVFDTRQNPVKILK